MLSNLYRRTTQHPLWIALYRAVSISLERPVPRYAAGLTIFFLALALRFAILPLNGGIPFLTFYPAVTIAALLCGTGPALMVIVLGGMAADYIFMEPYWSISYKSGAIASEAVFALSGLLICLIVHRNRKEEAAQALLAAIVASSENAIISKTPQGIITSWNPEAERLFGYTAAEAMEKPMTILIPLDRYDEEAELLARVARGERVSHYETKRLRKNGSIVDVSVTLSPIRDRQGRIVGASKIANDITERKAMEAAQSLLASIVASSGDAIISKSMQGIITSWNPAAERIFGYMAEEILGSRATILYPRDRLHEEEALNSRNAKGESIVQFETMRRRKDGSLVLLSSSLSPILDRFGHAVGVSVIAHDISERRAAEMHLVQMEARYRGLLEAAPDAIVVVNTGGEIVLVNAQAERQFGYRRDELLGQAVKSIIPQGFAERLIADGARSAAEALAQQIGMGIELDGRRKDGTVFPIEIMLSPLESPEGILVTAAIRDIGKRRAAEKHLVQMESRYRGLLEAAPDAIVVVNTGGEIVLVNAQAERQFGYRRDELLGQAVKSIIPQGFAERLIADGARSAAEALAQQIGMGIELDGLRKDGTVFPIEIMLSPLESPEGILVTAAIRDIGKRRALAESLSQSNLLIESAMAELKRSNQELDEFARVAAHDLKEPLRGIHNYVSFLLEDYASLLDEQGRNYLASMQRLATRMAGLIDCLLDYSRLGSAPMDMEAVNLEAVLDEVAEDLKHFLIDHGVELRRPVCLPMVIGNAIRLGELLQNLITNGAKFNDNIEKWVEVSYEGAPDSPVFSVRDNGIGIPRQHQENVFGIFKRLHTQDKYGGGTGAGLTVSRKIVERHGGRIWLESIPGEGTTIRFPLAAYLPVHSHSKRGS
jgi:PAS domain S-box-containing protein